MPNTSDTNPRPVSSVFVYGTLKTGQCRSSMWPVDPLSIKPAWVHGSLFGRRDYPAMKAGTDRIAGEAWQFQQSDLEQVLEVLDQIEGANQPGEPDLYHRVVVETRLASEVSGSPAYTYLYAGNPPDDGFELLQPDENGFVSWPTLDKRNKNRS